MYLRRFILSFMSFCVLAGASFSLNASEAYLLGFRLGGSGLDTTYKYNARASARVRESLSTIDDALITVTAYSSPDGKYSRNRQLAALRAASAKDMVLSFCPASSNYTVIVDSVAEDWEGVKAYLRRSKLEWKDDALSILSSKEGDKKALLQDLWVGEAWEDLIKNCFPALRRVVIKIEKNPSTALQEADSGGCQIVFSAGSSALNASLANNLTGLSELKQFAASGANTLYIYIKASPEGEEAANERLSIKRANRIKSKLISLGYPGEVVTVYEGEDWEGLARKVLESSDLEDKDAILDILADGSLDRSSRKKALQRLSYGKTWLRLMDEEMSGLRRAVISADKK